MPPHVLDECVVAAQIHRHGSAAVRADGDQLRRDPQVLLPRKHLTDGGFIVIRLLPARAAALEQAVIALRVKQALFAKSGLLEAVIHVRGDDKIVLAPQQRQKRVIHRLRRVLIAVEEDIPAPVRPGFLRGGVGVKPAGIHIVKAVFCCKIREILAEPLAGVRKPGRRGQTRARADDHRVRGQERFSQALKLAGAAAHRSPGPGL